MTLQKGPYFIHCVENSSPSLKVFKTKKAMETFVENFDERPNDGWWIDFSFKGDLLYVDSSYEFFKPKKKK